MSSTRSRQPARPRRPARPWHTDRAPIIALVDIATDLARWAAKVGGDIAQLVQLGEITTRAGGSSAAAGKRNPIDAMRATAAAEVCLGVATVITHAKPHELERGLGSWHAEWFAVPLVFQTAGAAMEAIGAALASLDVEPSALVVADDRRAAADAYVTSVLEQITVTSFATTPNGTRIAYSIAGRPWRPSLILTHSLGSDHHMWDPQVQALKEQYYIVSIDNIGHGESDVPAGDYSVADMAGGVHGGRRRGGAGALPLLRALGRRHHRPVARRAPSRSAAVAHAVQHRSQDRYAGAVERAHRDRPIARAWARWSTASSPDGSRPTSPSASPNASLRARPRCWQPIPTGYAGVCAALRDADLRDDVGSITTPTLVIGGIADQATPIEQARWLHEQIAGSRLVELDAAHLSNLDREAEFTAALDQFLAEHTP